MIGVLPNGRHVECDPGNVPIQEFSSIIVTEVVTREEMERMYHWFRSDVGKCLDCGKDTYSLGEYYMVHDDVWKKAVPERRGMLCILHLEKRLGRKLKRADFTNCPLNTDNLRRGSKRLISRMTH